MTFAVICFTVLEQRPLNEDLSTGSGLLSKTFFYLEPFITNAFASLVCCEKCVLITMLCDTGARHSFIVESLLPFFAQYRNGGFYADEGNGTGLNSCVMRL